MALHPEKAAKLKSMLERAVTIDLSEDQRAALKATTGGKIDAKSLKLRPDLDLREFLKVLEIDPEEVQLGAASGPDTYWA
jgi:hypothetical protein